MQTLKVVKANIGQHQLEDQVSNCRVGQSQLYVARHKPPVEKWDGNFLSLSFFFSLRHSPPIKTHPNQKELHQDGSLHVTLKKPQHKSQRSCDSLAAPN